MLDVIPIQLYTPLYYHILLGFILVTVVHSQILTINHVKNLSFVWVFEPLLLVFVLLYMGLRPINGVFGDMTTYNHLFQYYKTGGIITSTKDVMFHAFVLLCTKIMTVQAFFFLCAALYIIPAYIISKKWFKDYSFYAFLLLVGSFSFWAYGTNGIRNGLATAMFLVALSFEKRTLQILFLLLSIGFHKSLLLPSAGYIATWFYNRPQPYFYFWLASIPLSLALPGFWESFFASMLEDDRASYLTTEASEDVFSKVGFRWDFLLYSAVGVFAGYWYIFKSRVADKRYVQLFNIYLFANAFWILVIRSNFSNRFAYLSWFLLALVVIYPWIKYEFTDRQYEKTGGVILAYYGLTYIMAIVL